MPRKLTVKNLDELSIEAILDRFDKLLADKIATEYSKPVEVVSRALLCCRLAGVSNRYYLDRYCKRLNTEMNHEVDYHMRILTGLIKE